MRKKLVALLMALVMVFSLNTTFLAAPGDSAIVDNTQEVKEVGVEWDYNEKGIITWKVKVERDNDIDVAQYRVNLYNEKDELIDWNYEFINNNDGSQGGEYIWFNFSYAVEMEGPGKYYVTVEMSAPGNQPGPFVVVGTGKSDVAEYKLPEKQLDEVKASVTDGVLTFDMVEGAAHYVVKVTDLYYSATAGAYREGTYLYENVFAEDWYMDRDEFFKYVNDGKSIEFNFAKWFENQEEYLKELYKEWNEEYVSTEHSFKFYVQARTANISEVQSSKETEAGTYEIKITLTDEQIKEIIENVDDLVGKIENVDIEKLTDEEFNAYVKNVDNAKNAISAIPKAQLVEKMLDPDFIENVGVIEAAYASLYNIKVNDPVSTSKAVDASKVAIVGSALNAWSGQEVTLKIADATEAKTPEGYKNGVALDISLFADDVALKDLVMPVVITMPIPAGVDTKDLVILHYHGDATEPIVITPVVEDGYMTFSVSGFSTFIVANAVADSPKTADNAVAVACAMMLVAAAAVVVFRKKAVK